MVNVRGSSSEWRSSGISIRQSSKWTLLASSKSMPRVRRLASFLSGSHLYSTTLRKYRATIHGRSPGPVAGDGETQRVRVTRVRVTLVQA